MNRLKECRENKALSREQLAVELGVSVRYIGFLERGERTPSLCMAQKIADYFGTSIEDIFLNKKCTKSTFMVKKGE